MSTSAKPSKRSAEAASRRAAKLLDSMKTFEEWCREATPEQRAAVEQHPGGARAFYDEHVARLQGFVVKGRPR